MLIGGELSGSVVEVRRGRLLESLHRVSIAVVDGSGVLRGSSGAVETRVFARSAIKPVQALPLVEDNVAGRFGLTPAELALACGSHSGEAAHVAAARSVLHRIGVSEDALACGAHAPFHEPSARELRTRGEAPGRIHNNCSGKHAGMLALAQAHGWALTGYERAEHPVQQRMLSEVSVWSDVAASDIGVAVDGCGVATFALPLRALAATFARLASAARTSGSGAAQVVAAMVAHPAMVAGTGRLCTELLRVLAGRGFVKVGAEGVYCAGLPEAGLGVALKVQDGAKRAAEPALLAVLHALGALDEAELAELAEYASPAVRNTRGDVVGSLVARVELAPHG